MYLESVDYTQERGGIFRVVCSFITEHPTAADFLGRDVQLTEITKETEVKEEKPKKIKKPKKKKKIKKEIPSKKTNSCLTHMELDLSGQG